MYKTLDNLIIAGINAGPGVDAPGMLNEAKRLAAETGRESFRVIDGRLQALRKAGLIRYASKAEAPNGKAGWHVVQCQQETQSQPPALVTQEDRLPSGEAHG